MTDEFIYNLRNAILRRAVIDYDNELISEQELRRTFDFWCIDDDLTNYIIEKAGDITHYGERVRRNDGI